MEDKVIVVASGNQGKIKEFKEMLEPEGYTVKSLSDFPDMPEVEETGTTFHDNAIIKAQAVTDRYGITAISDDSGLEIDALDKKPGVMSARWLGHDTSYDVKNQKVLDLLKDKKDRTCRYVCAIAITRVNEEPVVFEDTVECEVALEAKGSNGFGYDPIIYYAPSGKTMAEMSKEEKNSISHRGKAVRKLEAWLDAQKH
ncbi:XTP/dITP diphosphatase [Bulleidia sp. HCP3S3_F2]|mgnify:FL=1|jgi:XTP/dITP diphosphohydrolase|uniref:XTP/dITP diphosphatase n=1 Tax=unclassified Bulleidia TaxID=2704656 RepID=UPI002A90513B|nr:XTP/dITP diphosphatase [Erysipelotrichaceae bacterium]MDD7059077.1 XTP/dITP diphosphatase [Erysipelotrichaceae bacterium]MDY3659568.1 XTP/dITP diphosphatase [Bulleidia sp.]